MTPTKNTAGPTQPTDRDYSTISPSAVSLLLMKGITNIPFARQAAERMLAPEKYHPDLDNKELSFWARVVHFEDRYWSIDQLLRESPVSNILELSSGFSFRGLETTIRQEGHYIDTDLPGVIAQKKDFVEALRKEAPAPKGELEIVPLNALDAAAFEEVTGRFPAGPLAIVNEGLLMYLGMEEKEQLCGIIRRVLTQRGGYWITADIYIKRPPDEYAVQPNDTLGQFFEQHRVRENMFDSFEAAKSFFENAGFVLEKEAVTDRSKLSALPRLLEVVSPEQLTKISNMGKIRATWRLYSLPR